MHDVEDDEMQNDLAGLSLILVQDGLDAAQSREKVSNEQSCKMEQGWKEEAKGHCYSASSSAGALQHCESSKSQ